MALFCQGAATPASRRSYRVALAVLEAVCSEQGVGICSELTPGVVAAFPGSLIGLAPSTRRHRLGVARNFLAWAAGAGWVDPSCAGVLRPGRPVAPARDAAWSLCEVEKVLAAGDTWRDRALLWVLAATGARIGEVVQARVADLNAETLTIHGKTGTRGVPLCPEALHALAWYLRHRPGVDVAEPLFISRQGRLSERRARDLVYAACRKAGIRPRGPHSFRHAAAARWLRAGVPLVVVAAALGHSRPSTTLDHYSTVIAGDLARGLSADPLWADEPGHPPGRAIEVPR
ncbi:MAG TPA: site-specific integrase [Candidatus Dormibacteraeota bacterium]|nr:site-specific integrase [Candidatus Dormibacteraeota bacterium]